MVSLSLPIIPVWSIVVFEVIYTVGEYEEKVFYLWDNKQGSDKFNLILLFVATHRVVHLAHTHTHTHNKSLFESLKIHKNAARGKIFFFFRRKLFKEILIKHTHIIV